MINFKKLEDAAYAMMPKNRKELRCFHVAGIYKKNKLISLGYNQNKTHPKIQEYNYHSIAKCHAELMACLRGGKEDYTDHRIAVLRIDRNDKINYSKPCNGCLSAIKQLGFKSVHYTNADGEWLTFKPAELETTKKPNRFKK